MRHSKSLNILLITLGSRQLTTVTSVIRNETCLHGVVTSLHAVNRVCLTGTPLHNRIGDLHMLFKFLHIKPFQQDSVWYRQIVQPVFNGDLKILSQLLRYFMLRRTKASHLPHLPPINHQTVVLDMVPEAKKTYDEYYQRFLSQFGVGCKTTAKPGEYFKQLSNLRMTCNHPLLFKLETGAEVTRSINEMEETLGIMIPDERNRPADARPAFRQDWILSHKLLYLVSNLEKKKLMRKKDPSLKKTVIYSQWRSFMDW